MNPKKRQNVPVDEVMTRLKRGHTIEQITRDLRHRTGELFSTSLLRRVATDAGWRFSTTAPQRSHATYRIRPQPDGALLLVPQAPHR